MKSVDVTAVSFVDSLLFFKFSLLIKDVSVDPPCTLTQGPGRRQRTDTHFRTDVQYSEHAYTCDIRLYIYTHACTENEH
jgi:hypothetical protein